MQSNWYSLLSSSTIKELELSFVEKYQFDWDLNKLIFIITKEYDKRAAVSSLAILFHSIMIRKELVCTICKESNERAGILIFTHASYSTNILTNDAHY